MAAQLKLIQEGKEKQMDRQKALDAALAPVVDLADPPVQPLGRGWALDFTINQFVKNGISPALVYDTDELNVWIEKAMRTARLAYPIYTDDYGMEDPFRLIGQPNEPKDERQPIQIPTP